MLFIIHTTKQVLLEEALADIDQTLVTLGNKDHEEVIMCE